MQNMIGHYRKYRGPRIAAILCRCALVAAFIASFTSTAAAIRYRFSGEVTTVALELTSEFSIGETFRGRMWIDPTPRTGCSICLGDTYVLSHMRATFGGDYMLTSPEGWLTIIDDFAPPFDMATLGTTTGLGMSGPSVGSHVPDYLHFTLRYDDLPSTDLLPQFVPATDSQSFGLRFDINDELEVEFTLSDFSVVPEPGGLMLVAFAVGAASIGRLPRRNR